MLNRLFSTLAVCTITAAAVFGCTGGSQQAGNPEAAASSTGEVEVKEVFSGGESLNGTPLKYPEGKPQLRLYRVEIPVGGKIPLHTHPAPMLVYVQAENSGDLLNTRVQPDGTTVSSVFKPGESFIEGMSEPHYVENEGDQPTVVWVMVASVEGLPTTEWIK